MGHDGQEVQSCAPQQSLYTVQIGDRLISKRTTEIQAERGGIAGNSIYNATLMDVSVRAAPAVGAVHLLCPVPVSMVR